MQIKTGGVSHYFLWRYIVEAGEPPSDVLVLSALCCPLTHKPFQTPVMACDDRVYEEAAILHLFEQADRGGYIARSPRTQSPLMDRMLLPAPALTRVQEELEGLLCDVRRAIHQTLHRLGALLLERSKLCVTYESTSNLAYISVALMQRHACGARSLPSTCVSLMIL